MATPTSPAFSGPAPELLSERLRLRAIRPYDLQVVHQGLSDPEVTRYYDVHFDTLEQTRTQMQWFSRNERSGSGRWWAVCDERNPRDYSPMIGACGVNVDEVDPTMAELGYWLLPSHWGQGLACEAVACVLEHLTELGRLDAVLARVDEPNQSSAKLLVKLGFAVHPVEDSPIPRLVGDEVLYKLSLPS